MLAGLLRAATRKEGPLSILLMGASHERYETQLARTNHNFYMLGAQGLKRWDDRFAPVPPNYHELVGHHDWFSPDLILCQSRFEQYKIAKPLSQYYGCPLVCINHVLPLPKQFEALKDRVGHINVYVSEHNRSEWGDTEGVVVEHAIDEVFEYKDGYRRDEVLSVVNQWELRNKELGFDFWKTTTHDLYTSIVGDNPGLSEPAKSIDELVYYYQTHKIFLNTSRVSSIPTSLLEAMRCGCVVVSTKNPMIESVIEDGVTGYLISSPEQANSTIKGILANYNGEIGKRASEYVKQRFGLTKFINQYNEIFEVASQYNGINNFS